MLKVIKLFFVVITLLMNSAFCSDIFTFIQENKTQACKKLLAEGDEIYKQRDGNNNTPLHYAVFFNNVEIASLLLLLGAEVDALGQNSFTPLEFAIKQDHADMVSLLITRGANPNQANSNGICVLAQATFKGSVQVIRALLDGGADVNFKTQGFPVFHMATRMKNADDNQRAKGLNALLEFGNVDVNEKVGPEEQTALHFVLNCVTSAASGVYDDAYKSVVQALINKGADVNAKDKQDLTALYLSVKKNFFKISEMLLKSGSSVDVKDKFDQTPLFVACMNNNPDIVQLLAQHGADLNLKTKNKLTPLDLALTQGFEKVAKVLIEKGVDVNTKSESDAFFGSTPLHLAVQQKYSKLVSLLIKNNARVDELDSSGKKPLDYAKDIANESIKEKIIKELSSSLPEKLKMLTQKLHALKERIASLGSALEALKEAL